VYARAMGSAEILGSARRAIDKWRGALYYKAIKVLITCTLLSIHLLFWLSHLREPSALPCPFYFNIIQSS